MSDSGTPDEVIFVKSEAVLRIVEDVGGRVLGTTAYFVRHIIPRVLRDFVYSKCVAPNRSLHLCCVLCGVTVGRVSLPREQHDSLQSALNPQAHIQWTLNPHPYIAHLLLTPAH